MKKSISILLLFLSFHMGAQELSLCNWNIINVSITGQVGFGSEGTDYSKVCIKITGVSDLCNENGDVVVSGLTLTLESKGCKKERTSNSGMSKDQIFIPFELLGEVPEFGGAEIPIVYPNPSKGLYTLKTKQEKLKNKITVVSISNGKQLKNIAIEKSDKGYVIDLTPYPDGMYLLTYDYNNQSFSQKIIKK